MTKTPFMPPDEPSKKEPAKSPAPHGKGAPVDHKAAIAKMHPEHLHNLVQQAHAGKFGPEAQQQAQQAMQPAAPANDGDADDQPQAPQRNVSSIFGGGQPAAPAAPASRGSMFAGRGGGF